MKAMLIENETMVWRDTPDPVIGAQEVLVRVVAAGVNRADVLQVAGRYPSPEGCPDWPGLEISGVIEAVGAQVTRWQVGDKVCALLGGGGYAQYVSVCEDMCLPIPKGFTMEEAAGLPEVFTTAYLDLMVEGRLKAGETAYIPAGASGLAGAAIPLAKAFGARVITTVRAQENTQAIANLPADLVLVDEPLPEGETIDVAMDCLGGAQMAAALGHMNRGGRWIQVSTLAGVTADIPLRAVLTRGLTIKGSTLRSRTPQMKAQLLAELYEKVWPLLESGVIRPRIDRVLPMEQAAQAHATMVRGEHTGKMILKNES